MINRILLPIILLAALAGLWAQVSKAQTIGCSNVIYGSLSLITEANAQTIVVPCNSTPQIQLSATTIIAGSADGTTLGTATAPGTTGTATWSLSDVSGTFQINSSTGVVTVLNNTDLTVGNTLPIVISVTGLTPVPGGGHFTITVVASCTTSLNFAQACNSQYLALGGMF